MTFSLQTHIEKASKGGDSVIVRSQPYARLNRQDESPIYIQNGCFYFAGGEGPIKLSDLPDWAGDELAKMTPEARREVGLK